MYVYSRVHIFIYIYIYIAWRLRESGDLRCAGRKELCGSNGGFGEFVI
jgi:hypothetical protein